MKAKWLAVGIILLFISLAYAPAMAQTTEKPLSTARGNWLYVGGSGPGNYTTIQSAINDANPGDTVFVYNDSSPYSEAVEVNRSISLIGEEKHTTVIDPGSIKDIPALNISVDTVVVQGFTIQNSTTTNWSNYAAGIFITADNVLIKDTIIKDNSYGISVGGRIHTTLYDANHCVIEENDITNNLCGIYLDHGNYSTIAHNYISLNGDGIRLQSCHSTLITLNQITENDGTGIGVIETTNASILQNNITSNQIGFDIIESSKNSIEQNNIYKNDFRNVWGLCTLYVSLLAKSKPFDNTWDGNYWGRTYQAAKPIFGFVFFLFPSVILSGFLQPLKLLEIFLTGGGGYAVIPLGMPIIKYDQHPAQEPYDIPRIAL